MQGMDKHFLLQLNFNVFRNQTTLMKLVLDTKDMMDGFFEETKLLGIMAPMKD